MGVAVNIDQYEEGKVKTMWHAEKINHIQPTYYNPISTRWQDNDEENAAAHAAQASQEEQQEGPATYTAEEAAAFNLNLDGALAYGAIKEEAVEAVEGVHFTQEEIDAAQEGDAAYGKTTDDWKVEPVEAKDAVPYTNEEVDAYNAALPGAVKAGDEKPVEQQP